MSLPATRGPLKYLDITRGAIGQVSQLGPCMRHLDPGTDFRLEDPNAEVVRFAQYPLALQLWDAQYTSGSPTADGAWLIRATFVGERHVYCLC